MTALPESLFTNPVWHALQTKHRHLCVSEGQACRYPADVAPFAAVAAPTAAALRELHGLLTPDECVWVFADNYPRISELSVEETLQCLQMVLPAQVTPPVTSLELTQLCARDAPQMGTLTDLAFPGFFRARTYAMGSYYGVRSDGELIAMGGERLMLDGYPEISGICTHPAHRGRSFAAGIIWQLVRNHRENGLASWLHVGAANTRAIEL
jgi:predicted GNAT family acetyltransferase